MRLSALLMCVLVAGATNGGDPGGCDEEKARGERARRSHESQEREHKRTEGEMYKQTARPDDNPYRNAYPSGPSTPSPVQPDVR